MFAIIRPQRMDLGYLTTRELGLVYRRDRTLPRCAAAFVSMVRHGFGDSDHGHTGHSAHTAKKQEAAK